MALSVGCQSSSGNSYLRVVLLAPGMLVSSLASAIGDFLASMGLMVGGGVGGGAT